ncbi:MAG: gamma-glutamyltransferase, partial [Betaproteobacteria bacterium]|nr:gamma-glutamyltransferase [Betaproteobacteria bacterium]
VLGSPGGHRIPAIVLQAIVERRHYGASLDHALGLPRLSLGMTGEAECEAPLLDVLPQARVVEASDYFGPASGISCAADGRLQAARDPRFESGAATA